MKRFKKFHFQDKITKEFFKRSRKQEIKNLIWHREPDRYDCLKTNFFFFLIIWIFVLKIFVNTTFYQLIFL